MKRILALWLPNWPVQRLRIAQPELADRAVLLYEQHARYGEVIKACCPLAGQHGVQVQMPLAEAQALLRTPQNQTTSPAHIAPYDASTDRETLQRLAAWCEQFSPLVGLDTNECPDCLFLDITGLELLFGSELTLATRIYRAFQQCSYQVTIATAGTLRAAQAMAYFGTTSESSEAIRILEPDDQETLAALPVAALQLSESQQRQFRRLGIQQLADLQRLPRATLATRFGQSLLQQLDKLTGHVQEAIVAYRPPAKLATRRVMEYGLKHRQAIELVLHELLEQLSEQLSEQGQGALQVVCHLHGPHHPTCEITIGLFQPTVDPQHLLSLALMQLETCSLPPEVEELHVEATLTAPRVQRQAILFDTASREDPNKLALLIERLSSRLGHERVVRPQLLPDAQPELAYRHQPLTGEAAPVRVHSSQPDTPAPSSPWLRPLYCFPSPRQVEVIGLATGRPPAAILDRHQQHRVARYFGPERIETGWWRGPSTRRDYYRIETESGNRLWLFRQLPEQTWFLHGVFE